MKIDIAWKESAAAFQWDGSWRDIYVLDTTRDDWQRLLAHIAANHREATLDDKPLSSVIDFDGGRGRCLTVSLGSVIPKCHFFAETEIEFDFDPRSMTEQNAHALAAFMAELGSLLDKVVVLTPENTPVDAIYRYDPTTRVVGYRP
jgi:hypothetical protein